MMSKGQRTRSGSADLREVWNLESGDAGFPANLVARARHGKPPVVHGVGNREILRRRCLGLICSVQCPGSVVIKTLDAIRELRDAGVIVAGGFHSPMEQDCLDFLLRGDQAVVISEIGKGGSHRIWIRGVGSG